MSFFHFYVRNGKAVIPTVAITEEGFYLDIEPVSIVNVSDKELLKEKLLSAIASENPRVPTPERADEPGSVVLERVSVKRWDVFERQSVLFTIHSSPDAITLYETGRGQDGMWTRNIDQDTKFEPETPLPVIVEAIVAAIANHPEHRKPTASVPMLLPQALPPPKSE